MKTNWWKQSVAYQIYPQSFFDSNNDGIGDINGIIEKLDYIQELGVDVIWISPMLKSPLDDNGYDISDYKTINKIYGDNDDYKNLIEQAHKRNIKVLMDLVVNHSSDEHEWFKESRKSKDNPYRDYYIWRQAKDGKEPNNWGSVFGGSAWELDPETNMYYLHLFSKKQPDLNWENKALRQEIYSMMHYWCKMGVDGFRMDVIDMISKNQSFEDGRLSGDGLYGDFSKHCVNGPRIHEFLKEMNEQVLSKYDLMTVGEASGATEKQAINYANSQGSELDMVFHFEHVGVGNTNLGKFTTNRYDFKQFKNIFIKWQTALYGKAWDCNFLSNHDQPRSVSRFGDDRPMYREVSAKMLATFTLSLFGTPFIYQGEELGMTNAYFDDLSSYKDLESLRYYKEYTENNLISTEEMMKCLKLRSRDNARTPFHWDDSEHAGFTKGKPWIDVAPNYKQINAKEQIQNKDSVFNYYKKLIKLRKENDEFIYGSFTPYLEELNSVFAFKRKYNENETLIICNFTENFIDITIPRNFVKKVLLSNYNDVDLSEDYKLRPYEAIIVKSDDGKL